MVKEKQKVLPSKRETSSSCYGMDRKERSPPRRYLREKSYLNFHKYYRFEFDVSYDTNAEIYFGVSLNVDEMIEII